MTTSTPQLTIVPACRQAFRRFLRAQRAYRAASENAATTAASGVNPTSVEAQNELRRARARANTRRRQLIACLETNGRPGTDILDQPGLNDPWKEQVPPPAGYTEDEDETITITATAAGERCGAMCKDFTHHGYCDRYASKDGGYCYQHA